MKRGNQLLVSILLLFLFTVLLSSMALAVEPEQIWNATYISDVSDLTNNYPFSSVKSTADGGYIACGTKNNGTTDQAWVVKTDSLGNEEYNATFASAGISSCSEILQISSGDFVFTGTFHNGADKDARIVKLNASLDLIWEYTHDLGYAEKGNSIIDTSDGGFAITGATDSILIGTYTLLLKVDSSGSLVFNTSVGSPHTLGHSIEETADSGFIITGGQYQGIGGHWYVTVVKTTSIGTQSWENVVHWGNGHTEIGRDLKQIADGSYIVCGETYTSSSNMFLLKLDSLGNQTWNSTGVVGGSAESIIIDTDGGYLVTGKYKPASDTHLWLSKHLTNGSISWSKFIEGSSSTGLTGYEIDHTNDGSLIIAGANEDDGFLVKFGDVPANLTLTKTALTPSVENETVAEFFINVTNVGTVDVTNYWLDDIYDGNYFDFDDDVSINYTDYNETTNEIGWEFDLNASQSFLININFTMVAVGNTTNNVSLYNDSDAEIAVDFASQEITAPAASPAANLTLTKTALTPSVENETVAEFKINVTNIGEVNATDYSVWDEYDDYFDFNDDVSIMYDEFNETTNEIGWFFNLSTSESFILYINFTMVAVGNTTNNATLENDTNDELDFDFVNQEITAPDITAPVITLLGAAPQFIEVGVAYTELNATASDNVDGDLSPNITIDSSTVNTNVLGNYTVTYDVTDSSGNPATQVNRTVVVQDTTDPVITLLGAAPQFIEVGTAYTELNASASDNYDGDISTSIVIDSSTVDINTVANYTVTYDVTDSSGNTDQENRTVVVQDTTDPVITLIGDNPQVIEVGGSYTELNASASDNYDGDISTSIVIDSSTVDTNTVANYTVTYDVTDSSGNTDQENRTVVVQDTVAPVITLLGAAPQYIEVGTAYTELNASASDNYDGDISTSIVIDSSTVNMNVLGNYTVTYDVSDSSGNPATQVNRTVVVQDTTDPVITLTGVNPQTIEKGVNYTELNATANDNYDGDISTSVVIDSSTVDTDTIGNYIVTYDVTDSSANTATQVTRNVTVQDTTDPVISSVSSSTTTSGATITWTTDEVANSSVDYGATISLGSEVTSASSVTSHSMTISGLAHSKVYYYNVTSCDSSGNCKLSGDYNFTTATPTSSGGSSSSSSSGAQINYPSSDLSTTPLTFKVFKGSMVAFRVSGNRHSVFVKDLQGDVVTLRFKSEEVFVDVKEGETKRVDLDADGEDDVEVAFTKLEGKFVTIDLKQISPLERIQDGLETEAEEEDVDVVTSDGSAEDETGKVVDGDKVVEGSETVSEDEGSSNVVAGLLAVLTIAIVLGVWYWFKKSNKSKKSKT